MDVEKDAPCLICADADADPPPCLMENAPGLRGVEDAVGWGKDATGLVCMSSVTSRGLAPGLKSSLPNEVPPTGLVLPPNLPGE